MSSSSYFVNHVLSLFIIKRKKAPETLDVIRGTVRYMENVIHTNPTYDLSEETLAGCTNREDLCAFRAAIGGEHMMWLLIRDGGFTTFSSLVSSTPHSECEQYPTYMKTNCAPSCRTCGFITDPPLEPESPRFPDDFVHPCQDDEPRCPVWAREGECKANPGYMLQSCAGSCGICQLPQEEDADADAVVACVDKYDRCDEWEKEGGGGGCSVNPVCEFGDSVHYFPPRVSPTPECLSNIVVLSRCCQPLDGHSTFPSRAFVYRDAF